MPMLVFSLFTTKTCSGAAGPFGSECSMRTLDIVDWFLLGGARISVRYLARRL